MIKYALACDQAHEFESWFRSSDDYEMQAKQGFVTCPFCGSGQVEKQVMAPRVARTDKGSTSPAPTIPVAEPAAPPQPVALLSEPERQVRAMLRAVREHVTKTADYVGPGFADEARRMHHGEIEHRSIYGEAGPEEARALREEGIEVHPLPLLPDEHH